MQKKAPEDKLIERIPAASKEAVDFLSLIEIKDIQPCLFEESLVTISETGETIGTFSISVKWACYSLDGWQEEDCFLVHANSKGTIDGVPCKTSLTASCGHVINIFDLPGWLLASKINGELRDSLNDHMVLLTPAVIHFTTTTGKVVKSGYITKKLEILEQHTQESVRFRDHPVETRTQVVKRHGQLYVTKTVVERDEEIHVDTFSYRCTQLQGLISESANFLVLRVMARRQSLPQNAVFLSFDSDQHICTSTYNTLGFEKQQVKKEEVGVFVIERTIHAVEAPPLNWQFCFLPDGHLSRRVQVGSPATMVILQVPILIDTDEPDPRPIFEKVLLDWEEDAELYSKFLDRKEELQASHATYVRRHPELSTLLADFLQLLLLRKPDDVVTFAAEFFAPFSAHQPPCRSFQSSDRPSPFRSHV